MNSTLYFTSNENKGNESGKIIQKKNEKKYKDSITTSFKSFSSAFSSALFMSDFQGGEENITSEKYISSNSGSEKNSKNNHDLKFSPSLEKCLTSELLDSITNDSSKLKKCPNQKFKEIKDNIEDNQNSQKFLKITKNLFNQENITPNKQKNNNSKTKVNINEYENEKKLKKLKNKDKITLYEETINGFEYQLKFIENSVHNILPKSYKKISNSKENNVFYNNINNNSKKNIKNINNQTISSLAYYNQFKKNDNNNYLSFYRDENIDYSNNTISNFEPFEHISENRNILNINEKNNNNYYNNSQIYHQFHKLKINNNSYYEDWICNNCDCLNRGYRKACSNCGNYRNIVI